MLTSTNGPNIDWLYSQQLRTLARVDRGDQQLDVRLAATTNNEFSIVQINNRFRNKARVRATRFQTRFRPRVSPIRSFRSYTFPYSKFQSQANVELLIQDQRGSKFTIHGRTGDVQGQCAEIIAPSTFTFRGKQVLDIITTSPGDFTQADLKRDAYILRVLQNEDSISDNPFLQLIWPEDTQTTLEWPSSFLTFDTVPSLIMDPALPLNNSQQTAVLHMLKMDNDHRMTIIQGPPGTGKTTVIGTYVQSATTAGATGIWLVAQSNVAVMNIGIKLIKCGFQNFRLLVSRDFHQDW